MSIEFKVHASINKIETRDRNEVYSVDRISYHQEMVPPGLQYKLCLLKILLMLYESNIYYGFTKYVVTYYRHKNFSLRMENVIRKRKDLIYPRKTRECTSLFSHLQPRPFKTKKDVTSMYI